ncbi:MAG: hypothetical protein OK441_05485 [Thaumarchaeota archaeon]|nr:hypothetical protein [Nitrososphaerota archaeon]
MGRNGTSAPTFGLGFLNDINHNHYHKQQYDHFNYLNFFFHDLRASSPV